jgi:hypothetical protein
VCGGSVSVFICDLCVRWLRDASVRLLLAGIASYFRVSVAASAAPVTAPVTCPNRVHRIKNRAIRLVPQCPDFLEKVLHFAAILSLLPFEKRVQILREGE